MPKVGHPPAISMTPASGLPEAGLVTMSEELFLGFAGSMWRAVEVARSMTVEAAMMGLMPASAHHLSMLTHITAARASRPKGQLLHTASIDRIGFL